MTDYEKQKVRDFVNALTDEEKAIAKEILDNWNPDEPWKKHMMNHFVKVE